MEEGWLKDALRILPDLFFLKLINLIYLFWLPLVLVAACGLFVAACMRDLVPQPGIEPGPPALGAWSLTHWTTREVPCQTLRTISCCEICVCVGVGVCIEKGLSLRPIQHDTEYKHHVAGTQRPKKTTDVKLLPEN